MINKLSKELGLNIPEQIFFNKESIAYPIFDIVKTARPDETVHSREISFMDGEVKLRLTMGNSSERGFPNEFDFRMYMLLVCYSNIHFQKNNEFPRNLELTLATIRRNLKIAKNGKSNKEILNSLTRLTYTVIETDVRVDNKKRFLRVFSLLNSFEYDSTTYTCKIDFNPDFIFDNSHIIKANQPSISVKSNQLAKISSTSTRLVYLKLKEQLESVIRDNKSFFTLTYDFLLQKHFAGWIKHKYLSQVKQQLSPTFKGLVESGIIVDFEIYKHQKHDSQGRRLANPKKDGGFRVDFLLKNPTQSKALYEEPKREKENDTYEFVDTGKSLMDLYREKLKPEPE